MFFNGLALLAGMLAVTANGPTQQGDVPAKIERFLKHCESSRRGAILRLEHTLRGLRSQEPATRQISLRIAEVEEQLRDLRSPAQPVVPQIAYPPQIGAIGRLPGLSCHVDQVLSGDEVVARVYFPVVVTTVEHFRAHRDKVVRPVRVVMRGISTEGMQEGADVQVLGVFEIAGKERHQTLDGKAAQILSLRPFDMKRVEPYFQRMVQRQR